MKKPIHVLTFAFNPYSSFDPGFSFFLTIDFPKRTFLEVRDRFLMPHWFPAFNELLAKKIFVAASFYSYKDLVITLPTIGGVPQTSEELSYRYGFTHESLIVDSIRRSLDRWNDGTYKTKYSKALNPGKWSLH